MESKTYTLIDANRSTQLQKSLSLLYKQGHFTDASVSGSDGQEVKCHLCVLAASSSLVHSIALGQKSKGDFVLSLPSFPNHIVKMYVDFIYSGCVTLNLQDITILKDLSVALKNCAMQSTLTSWLALQSVSKEHESENVKFESERTIHNEGFKKLDEVHVVIEPQNRKGIPLPTVLQIYEEGNSQSESVDLQGSAADNVTQKRRIVQCHKGIDRRVKRPKISFKDITKAKNNDSDGNHGNPDDKLVKEFKTCDTDTSGKEDEENPDSDELSSQNSTLGIPINSIETQVGNITLQTSCMSPDEWNMIKDIGLNADDPNMLAAEPTDSQCNASSDHTMSVDDEEMKDIGSNSKANVNSKSDHPKSSDTKLQHCLENQCNKVICFHGKRSFTAEEMEYGLQHEGVMLIKPEGNIDNSSKKQKIPEPHTLVSTTKPNLSKALYKCHICGIYCQGTNLYQRHQRVHFKPQKIVPCPGCWKRFACKSNLSKHICRGFKPSSKKSLFQTKVRAVQGHNQVRRFSTCPICDKEFNAPYVPTIHILEHKRNILGSPTLDTPAGHHMSKKRRKDLANAIVAIKDKTKGEPKKQFLKCKECDKVFCKRYTSGPISQAEMAYILSEEGATLTEVTDVKIVDSRHDFGNPTTNAVASKYMYLLNLKPMTLATKLGACETKRTVYACPHCDVHLSRFSGVLRHLPVAHGIQLPTINCPLCNLTFTYRDVMLKHDKKHHNEEGRCGQSGGMFNCQDCNVNYLEEHALNRHVENHRSDLARIKHSLEARLLFKKCFNPETKCNLKQYLCKFCGAGFRSHNKVENHMGKVHGFKPCKCEVCNLTFSSQYRLRLHKRSHEQKQFICDICAKACSSSYLLKNHIQNIHTGVSKMTECYICNKVYRTPSLYYHLKLKHSDYVLPEGETSAYQCDKCGGFLPSFAMQKIHALYHATNKYFFKCRMCDLSFKYAGSRIAHERRYHPKT